MITASRFWTPSRKVNEFLRYLLSREGQQVVVRDGRYLPLSAIAAQKERRKL